MLGRNKGQSEEGRGDMARGMGENDEGAISIIAAGMTIIGDCETGGTVRIEGRVEGTVRAGKSVVVGRGGEVVGDILTQDAVVSGRVCGNILAESRLELQATSEIQGEIRSRRVKLDEGARFNGELHIEESAAGERKRPKPVTATASSASSTSTPSTASDKDGKSNDNARPVGASAAERT